jgi:hypothetical protein
MSRLRREHQERTKAATLVVRLNLEASAPALALRETVRGSDEPQAPEPAHHTTKGGTMERQLPLAIITVPDVHECPGMLLDEWDTQIAAHAEALREAVDACRDLVAADEAMAIIGAETLLSVEGHTEAERTARALLALRLHDGWLRYRQQARAAQDRVREARRRAGVAWMRSELIRTALAVALRR